MRTEPSKIDTFLSEADPALGRLISRMLPKIGSVRIRKSRASAFESLVRAIVYQRMDEAAARTIYARLTSRFADQVTPQCIRATSSSALHAVGLSTAKAGYIKNIAQWFVENAALATRLPKLSNADVSDALTSITGVGQWTVNVFLIFTLGRLDVVPSADFGIQRAAQRVYSLRAPATRQFIQEKAQRWQPYPSIASIYLWQSLKTETPAPTTAKRASRKSSP